MNGPFGLPGQGPVRRFEARESAGFLPRGYIDGLTISNDTTDATNDIAIAPGVARSTCRIVDGAASTAIRDQMDLELPVSIIKQLDVAWAPDNYDPQGYSGGGRSGGRSSSAIASATWHVFLVGGGGLQPDVLLHDSVAQSSVLAEMQKIGGYTAYRHIMSVIRSAGAIIPFDQLNDYVQWITPFLDMNNATPGTSANTATLTVPTGIWLRVMVNGATPGGTNTLYISSFSQTDSPASTATGLSSVADGGNQAGGGPLMVVANTGGQIRYRANTNTTVAIATLGFFHPRGRDA